LSPTLNGEGLVAATTCYRQADIKIFRNFLKSPLVAYYGSSKSELPELIVGAFALGSQRLYDFARNEKTTSGRVYPELFDEV